jgi:hypothetical protein
MTTPKDEYKKLKVIEELKEELLKAFVKNAALRTRKLRFEFELARIEDRLKANDLVQEVLARKEFQGLEIAESSEFLKDIERLIDGRNRKQQEPGRSAVSGSEFPMPIKGLYF